MLPACEGRWPRGAQVPAAAQALPACAAAVGDWRRVAGGVPKCWAAAGGAVMVEEQSDGGGWSLEAGRRLAGGVARPGTPGRAKGAEGGVGASGRPGVARRDSRSRRRRSAQGNREGQGGEALG